MADVSTEGPHQCHIRNFQHEIFNTKIYFVLSYQISHVHVFIMRDRHFFQTKHQVGEFRFESHKVKVFLISFMYEIGGGGSVTGGEVTRAL
jgi:hypothetical protein